MRKSKYYVLVTLVLTILMVILSVKILLSFWLFRKVVLNPIPAYVKSIRGSKFFSSSGYRTSVLRFNISESDIHLILKSDQFNEIEYVKFNNNNLSLARFSQ